MPSGWHPPNPSRVCQDRDCTAIVDMGANALPLGNDCDGIGFHLAADLSICNAHQSGFVEKPCGHPDTCE
jgi:hypothetical protein